jgi:hypothetical protein
MQQECLSVRAASEDCRKNLAVSRLWSGLHLAQHATSTPSTSRMLARSTAPRVRAHRVLSLGGRYGCTDGQVTDKLAISSGDQITVNVFGKHARGVDEGSVAANERPSRGDRRSDLSRCSAGRRGLRRRAAAGLAERSLSPYTRDYRVPTRLPVVKDAQVKPSSSRGRLSGLDALVTTTRPSRIGPPRKSLRPEAPRGSCDPLELRHEGSCWTRRLASSWQEAPAHD